MANDSIELKKLKAELARVVSAKLDLDLRVDTSLEEIERLRSHIAIQEAKEQELLAKIADFKK